VVTSSAPFIIFLDASLTKTRAIAISVFTSASLKRVFWKSAIAWPNTLRSRV